MCESLQCVFVLRDGLTGPTVVHGCELCMVSVKGGRETEGGGGH